MSISLANDFDNLYAEGAFVWGDLANLQEKKSGKKVIRLQIGQPDFPPHQILIENIAQAYFDKKTGYGPPLGLDELRQAVVMEVQKYYSKAKITKNNVAITAGGGKSAINVVCRSVLNRNDIVLVPCYGYPGHLSGITNVQAKFIPYRLDPGKDYDIDIADFEKKVKHYNPKLVFLLSPGNPTGGVIKVGTLEKISFLAERFDLIIVSDEIYRAHVFDNKFTSILDFPKMEKRTIIIDGPGKRNCLTGARIGYIIGPVDFIDIAVRKLNNIFFSCPPTPEQIGLAKSINHPKILNYIEKMKDEFKKRRDYIVQELNKIKGVSCPKPGGAFYCFPDISETGFNGETFAKKLLEKENVCVLPGISFGGGTIDENTKKPFGYYNIRISFAASIEDLKEAIKRIKIFLNC